MKKKFKPPIKLFCLAILATVTLLGGVFTVNARAAANPEPQIGADGLVNVTVPTEIKCALLADGTVVTPSNLFVTNHEGMPVRMEAATETDYTHPVDYTLDVGGTRVLTRTNQVDTNGNSLDFAAGETKALQLGIEKLTRDKHTALIDAATDATTPMFRMAFNFVPKEMKAFAVYSTDDKSLNFYKRATPLPTVGSSFDGRYVTEVYTDIENTGTNPPWRAVCGNVTKVRVVDPILPLSCKEWFMNFSHVKTMDLTHLDTSKVTTMTYMFSNCSALTNLNISHFKTTNVTNMHSMFYGCSALTSLNLSRFDTTNVTNMMSMFNNCTALPALDLRHFNTSKVTHMSNMFYGCSALTDLDLSHFNAVSAINMDRMFANCDNLKIIHTPYNIRKPSMEGITSKTFFDETNNYKTYDPGSFPKGIPDSHTLVYVIPQAFAVYSADNDSLNFYKRMEVPAQGSRFEEQTVTEVYKGVENTNTNPPWTDIREKVTKVTVVDQISPTSCANWFFGFNKVTTMDLTSLDTSKATTMNSMFSNCSSLTALDLRSFNTSSVTDMMCMFEYCTALTALDLSSFDASKVTNMTMMFQFCYDLKNLKTPKNIDKPIMTDITTKTFYDTTESKEYLAGSFPTNITDSHTLVDTLQAFAVYSADDHSLNFYKRTKIPDVNCQFEGKMVTKIYTEVENTGINPPWKEYSELVTTVKVVDRIFPTSCANWFMDFRSVTTMNLTQLSATRITNMSNMFKNCTSLPNLKLTHLNTDKVTDMSGMFNQCSNLTSLNLSSFDASKVTDMSDMFANCTNLISIKTPKNIKTPTMTGITPKTFYDETDDCCEYLTGSFPTNIIDSHTLVNVIPPAFAVYSEANQSLNFYRRTEVPTVGNLFEGKTVTKVYPGVENTGTNQPWNDLCGKVTKVTVVDKFLPTSCANWFENFSTMKHIDLRKLDTSKVTTMADMFMNCSALTTLDLSTLDASKVTDMSNMFANCQNLKTLKTPQNIKSPTITGITTKTFYDETDDNNKAYLAGSFPTGITNSHTLVDVIPQTFAVYSETDHSLNFYKRAEVPIRGDLFEEKTVTEVYTDVENTGTNPPWNGVCGKVTTVTVVDQISPTSCANWFMDFSTMKHIDLRKLDTSKVTTMAGMFMKCTSLTALDLTTFNTSGVTDMTDMFTNCKSLTSLNLTAFNTSKVTTMMTMFSQCSALTALDLSSFDTSNVTNMMSMFEYCMSLTTLDLSNFDASKVTNMAMMFQFCNHLKTLQTPKNIKNPNILYITTKTFYDTSDNNKAYTDSFPTNIPTSHTLVDTKP